MTSLTRRRALKVFQLLYDKFGDLGWWPGETAFEIAVGAVLAQNVAWANVEKAIRRLKEAKLFSPTKLLNAPQAKLEDCLRPTGYYRIKAQRLRTLLRFFQEECNGNLDRLRKRELPSLRKKLLGIPGIGPETADSILLYALDKPTFVIDAYTRRVLSRIGWIGGNESYEELRRAFMKPLPPDPVLYNHYHALLVQLGKAICRRQPACDQCPLSHLCAGVGL